MLRLVPSWLLSPPSLGRPLACAVCSACAVVAARCSPRRRPAWSARSPLSCAAVLRSGPVPACESTRSAAGPRPEGADRRRRCSCGRRERRGPARITRRTSRGHNSRTHRSTAEATNARSAHTLGRRLPSLEPSWLDTVTAACAPRPEAEDAAAVAAPLFVPSSSSSSQPRSSHTQTAVRAQVSNNSNSSRAGSGGSHMSETTTREHADTLERCVCSVSAQLRGPGSPLLLDPLDAAPPAAAPSELLQPVGPKCTDPEWSDPGNAIPNACCHPRFVSPLPRPQSMPWCFKDRSGASHFGVSIREIVQQYGLEDKHGRRVNTSVWAYGPDCTETFAHRIKQVSHNQHTHTQAEDTEATHARSQRSDMERWTQRHRQKRHAADKASGVGGPTGAAQCSRR